MAVMRCVLALVLACLPAVTRAEPVRLHYEGYSTGFNIARLDADYDISPTAYRVHLAFRTAGTLRAVIQSDQDTVVDGRFDGGQPAPRLFFSQGHLRGRPRVTQIDYARGQPVIRTLTPANEEEREAVPAADQAGTVDSLSAMAQLVRQVNATGRCDGRSRTFDGRRLAELSAHTGVMETLERTSRSTYSGPALRCDLEGRQLGGFMLDADRAVLQRPQRAAAWFAAVAAGGPLVPVRIQLTTRFVGDVVLYLAPAE